MPPRSGEGGVVLITEHVIMSHHLDINVLLYLTGKLRHSGAVTFPRGAVTFPSTHSLQESRLALQAPAIQEVLHASFLCVTSTQGRVKHCQQLKNKGK